MRTAQIKLSKKSIITALAHFDEAKDPVRTRPTHWLVHHGRACIDSSRFEGVVPASGGILKKRDQITLKAVATAVISARKFEEADVILVHEVQVAGLQSICLERIRAWMQLKRLDTVRCRL